MQSFANLADIDPQLLNAALSDQRAATIAIVLRLLPSDRAPGIVGQLDREKLHAVVRCLRNAHGVIEPSIVNDIRAGLMAHIDAIQHSGPARAARILEQCDRQTEWSLLQSIADLDPDLAGAIDQNLFSFDCLALIDDRSLKTLLRNVDLQTWAMALIRSATHIKRRIMQQLCPRAIELLSEEIEYLSVASTAEINSAQAKIVDAARRLRRQLGGASLWSIPA